MFATVGVLAGGLYSFLQGNDPLKSNKMMQRRVLAQFGTVGLMFLARLFNSALGVTNLWRIILDDLWSASCAKEGGESAAVRG